MTSSEIYRRDLTALSQAIAAGELTPSDVTEAFLARIAAVESRVQAFTTLDVEGAQRQAEAMTEEARRGKLRSPLHGIPFGVKDPYHAAGMPTRGDPSVPPGTLQPVDSGVVRLLKAAGGVLVGKLWAGGGVSRNGWNLEHTPGGSSTGPGAAAGARELPYTIGEQTAGSHLRPAMFNGVVGFKPTFGRISRFGLVMNAWTLDHVGIMAQSVADTAIVYSSLAGPDPDDPYTLPDPPPAPTIEMAHFRPPRIGIVRDYFMETAQPEMQVSVEAALSRLAAAGASVQDFTLPTEFRLAWYAHGIIFVTERATRNAPYGKAEPSRGRGFNGRSMTLPDEVAPLIPTPFYQQSLRIRHFLQDAVTRTMTGTVDVLLTPTAVGPAPKASEGGGDPSFQSCWSFLGFPTIQVPNGLSAGRLPLGVQVIAPLRADEYLLQAAAWTETVLGRLPPVPLE